MTTHETVNRLYAEIQSLLRKNLGAEGNGVFALLKSVEGKLSAKLVWELRLIGNIRNQVVHECLEPVPRYFEALCGEAIEGMQAVPAVLAPKGNNSPKPAGIEGHPNPPVQRVPKAQMKPQGTNPLVSKQHSQKKQTPSGQSPAPHPQNAKTQKAKQQVPKQPTQSGPKRQPAKPQPSSTKQQPHQ
jgi:hypothetical protein